VAKNRRHRGEGWQRSLRRPATRAVQQCIVALIYRNASKWNLRHADAHDCRANDAMKVYKRCRQKAVF